METAKILITKEEMSGMPIVAFPGRIIVADTVEKGEQAIAELLESCDTVGFDTETKPSFRKGQTHSVALIQISTETTCYLFRVNKTGIFESLKQFLESEKISKIGLSLKDDFKVLNRLAPFTPKGFIDLQSVVGRFSIGEGSLQKIYAIIFGERISKSQRLSNWEAASLSASQCNYASIDAWACLRIYRTLMAEDFNPSLMRNYGAASSPQPNIK